MFVSEAKATTVEELSPRLVDELTKDAKVAIEKHNKEISKLQKDFETLAKSILILSGHQSEQLRAAPINDPAEKLVKVLEGLRDDVPIVLPDTLNIKRTSKSASDITFDNIDSWSLQPSKASLLSARHSLMGNLDQMDDNSIVEAVAEALRMNKFEPKGGIKALSHLSKDISNLFAKIHEFDMLVPSLKDGLSLKADKLDLQRLARYMKEQLQRPENAIFTTKPLYGFRCMSCDHEVEKLSPVAGEHLPTNRMPPQVLPMLSAERIFAFDRRGSNGSGFHNSAQQNKAWSGSFPRSQRGVPSRRPTSPRK